jgi:sensor histidine kinase YesM
MKQINISNWLTRLTNFNTVTFRMIGCFVAIIILSTSVISIMYYYKSLNFIKQQNDMYVNNLCKNITDAIDQYVAEMDRTSKILLGNSEIQSIIENSQQPKYPDIQRLKDFYEIQKLVLSFTSIRDRTVIDFYSKNGERFFAQMDQILKYDHHLFDNHWLRDNKKRVDARELSLIPPYASILRLNDGDRTFSVIRCLKTIDTNEVTAYITVSADVEVLLSIIQQNQLFKNKASIQVVDGTGTIVLDPDQQNIGSGYIRPNRRQIEVRYRSSFTGWTTVIKLPASYISQGLKSARNYSFLIAFIVIMFSMMLGILMSSYILKPIRNLTNKMALVEGGDFDITLDETVVNHDIKQLYKGFNRMVAEIKKLIQNIYIEKLQVKSSQLEALQFQINPHFLFNTLQTMEAIGEIRNVPEIQIITKLLGDLLRYNLRGENVVLLEEELDQIDKYFGILKIRFKGKIELNINVSESIRKCKTLKFILQPIVENSIEHGFRNTKGKGMVNIKAQKFQSELKISISDNGAGINTEKLKSITDKLQQISKSNKIASGDFVGIFNVHKRLVNYYGNAYGLEYISREQYGTMVVITLPLQEG